VGKKVFVMLVKKTQSFREILGGKKTEAAEQRGKAKTKPPSVTLLKRNRKGGGRGATFAVRNKKGEIEGSRNPSGVPLHHALNQGDGGILVKIPKPTQQYRKGLR